MAFAVEECCPATSMIPCLKTEKSDAFSFLLDETGEWADSRRTWCELAEINPEELRAFAGSL